MILSFYCDFVVDFDVNCEFVESEWGCLNLELVGLGLGLSNRRRWTVAEVGIFYAYSRLNCSISRLIYEYSGLVTFSWDLMYEYPRLVTLIWDLIYEDLFAPFSRLILWIPETYSWVFETY